MSEEERRTIGKAGREHVKKNYGMAQYSGLWYQTFKEVFENMGAWDTRKNYKNWEMFEIL